MDAATRKRGGGTDDHQSPLADSAATTAALTVSLRSGVGTICSSGESLCSSSEESSAASASGELHASIDCSLLPATHSITGRKFSSVQDKYRIDPRLLGRGHNGSVRACIDRATGQRYAVKSINKSNPSVKPAGLAREISLLQEMKHPNIVRLIDVFENTTYVHLVTDLCTGGELFYKIKEKSAARDGGMACFAEEDAARIIRQVLSAVSFMHHHNVVHRDLKPENVLFVTDDERSPVKIIDFGLARKHFAGEPPMTAITGTPYYIAPEVLRQSYDKACDLWSVGITAYILIAGYPPFNGTNSEHTRMLILRGEYSFDEEDWRCVSDEARDFIRRLLQMVPGQRMTADQALNHPWIVRHAATDNVGMKDDVLKGSVKKGLLPRKESMLRTQNILRKAMFGYR